MKSISKKLNITIFSMHYYNKHMLCAKCHSNFIMLGVGVLYHLVNW